MAVCCVISRLYCFHEAQDLSPGQQASTDEKLGSGGCGGGRLHTFVHGAFNCFLCVRPSSSSRGRQDDARPLDCENVEVVLCQWRRFQECGFFDGSRAAGCSACTFRWEGSDLWVSFMARFLTQPHLATRAYLLLPTVQLVFSNTSFSPSLSLVSRLAFFRKAHLCTTSVLAEMFLLSLFTPLGSFQEQQHRPWGCRSHEPQSPPFALALLLCRNSFPSSPAPFERPIQHPYPPSDTAEPSPPLSTMKTLG